MKQSPNATNEDLVRYGTFASLDDVPKDSEKLIMLASDIVMGFVRNNYNPSNEAHVLAVMKAICIQVSYWVETGESPLGQSDVSSYSLGELSVNIDKTGATQGENLALCRMALTYLNNEYLLYRGMRHGRA